MVINICKYFLNDYDQYECSIHGGVHFSNDNEFPQIPCVFSPEIQKIAGKAVIITGVQQIKEVQHDQQQNIGVGTELKRLLSKFGITNKKECPCNRREA